VISKAFYMPNDSGQILLIFLSKVNFAEMDELNLTSIVKTDRMNCNR
jgi:hypothetical protein